MEKYMGNKSKICNKIFDEITNYYQAPFVLFDAFAGTTNVSRYFKSRGCDVILNDINDLSYVLGKCYVENTKLPSFKNLYKEEKFKREIEIIKKSDSFKINKERLFKNNSKKSNKDYLEGIYKTKFFDVMVYLVYYCDEEIPGFHPFLQKNYCEFGENSKYINLVYKKTLDNIKNKYKESNPEVYKKIEKFYSSKFDFKYLDEIKKCNIKEVNEKINQLIMKGNMVGFRKFFSLSHAKKLDIILNKINYWYKTELITEKEFYILLASLIETITLFSNTSATYQAFYKEYKENTQQEFKLIIPQLDFTNIKSEIYQKDACELIPKIECDVLYLDPPYNWRQYDSNYHLLNTISKYHQIDDINEFEKNIVGASGENRVAKLKYTSFNVKCSFEELLLQQVKLSKSKLVVLSYSNSLSNHKRGDIDTTLQAIEKFFNDPNIFESFNLIEIDSRNFESRKGNKKPKIKELLFIAKKIK